MTPIFFALSPHFMSDPHYEGGIAKMAAQFDLKPVFAHKPAPGADPTEWIATTLSECEFAVFDLTALDPGVLFAYGISTQNDDVTTATFISTNEHVTPPNSKSGPIIGTLIAEAKRFVRADDLAREAQMFVASKLGASKLLGNAFIADVKRAIRARGPVHMRQLAQHLNRPMSDVQPVVYSLVREGKVRKISDRRWAHYESNER
jgi:hypothetical protein